MAEQEDRIDRVVAEAATKAALLALSEADRATKLAVERAVKDANIDRDLQEHGKHLEEINGSQREMAASLKNLDKSVTGLVVTLREQAAVNTALSEFVAKQSNRGFTRRTIWIGVATAIAAYLFIVVALLTKVA